MGVLGWSYDTVLDTPMPAIERALNSRQKLIRNVLQAIFGKPDEETAPAVSQVSTRPMSPALFDALFSTSR